MKKSLVALAIAGAFSGAAYAADTSVTLYGLVDASLHRVSHVDAAGHSQLLIDQGAWQGSRFGLKGTEDLGGGTNALFQIEGGFQEFNGQSDQQGQLFGRQAYVGLSNPTGGTLTLGRQYGPLWGIAGDIDALGIGNWGQNSWPFARLLGVRYDNAIMYSNNFGGSPANLALLYAPGGQPGNNAIGRTVGGSVEVNVAPFLFGLGTTSSEDANQKKDKVWELGGKGTFGIFSPGIVYIHSKKDPGFAKAANLSGGPLANTSLLNNTDVVTRTDKLIDLSSGFAFTPEQLLSVGVLNNKTSRSISYTERTVYVNYSYFLSKRTTVYGEVDFSHISNATAGSLAGIGSGYSNANDFGVGLRFKF